MGTLRERDQLGAGGVSDARDETMCRARVEFGGVDRIKEQCRDESRWNGLTQISIVRDSGLPERVKIVAKAWSAVPG